MTPEQSKRYRDMSSQDRDRFDLQRKIIKQGNKNGMIGGLGKGNNVFGECTCASKQEEELPVISQLVDNDEKSEQDDVRNDQQASKE